MTVHSEAVVADIDQAASRRRGFRVEVGSDWSLVALDWAGKAGPFQNRIWLDSWYASLQDRPGLTPLLVTARDADTGEVAIRLPLVAHRSAGLSVIEFADLQLTDYNAPVLGPAAPRDAEGARMLWSAIRETLPRSDLIRFLKMPAALGAEPNPLALLPNALPCALNGNIVHTGDDWDGWRRSLEKTVRKELERSWRVFSREPDTSFAVVTDPARAQAILDSMEAQQETRMRAKGAEYALDDPDFARFYRTLVERGLASGYVVLTALLAGDEVVASLLGVRDPSGYVMIRISNASGRWSNCSPGRLVIERTMAALHADGCRVFDFSVGNYDYKRRFGVESIPLFDLTEARGARGIRTVLRAIAVGGLRSSPSLDRAMRAVLTRLRGRGSGP